MAILEVKNLSVSYGAIKALRNISFSVEQGEIISLIGSNGAGKTTTLHVVSNIIKKNEGQVFFEGEDITNLSPDKIVAKNLIHVPEGRRIFQNLTVRENLELGAFLRKDKDGIKDDMENVFELFPRLKERIKQNAGTLSGGEQQMLAIGRGIMAKPKVLLLDEPSMGLAPILVDEIFSIIQKQFPILMRIQKALLQIQINIAEHHAARHMMSIEKIIEIVQITMTAKIQKNTSGK